MFHLQTMPGPKYSLFTLASIVHLALGQNQLLIQDGGQVQLCDLSNPCPLGYSCQYAHFIAGVKICYRSNAYDTVQRSGRCPFPTEPSGGAHISGIGTWTFGQVVTGGCGKTCVRDNDCPWIQQKCCFSTACGKSCSVAVAIEPSPKVTVLLDGAAKPLPERGEMFFLGTVTLVQSQGKNYLFDTGLPVQKIALIKALREKAGLELEDLDMVLYSHGHPGHISNQNLFPDLLNNFNKINMAGSKFMRNELASMPPERYFVSGDRNVELVLTPGHTMQDTTMLVYNVTNMGIVALAGDLVVRADDWNVFAESAVDPDQQRDNRRKVFCIANYIVPGHGEMFQVTTDMRLKAGGCSSFTK